jgi:multidrug resistance efflux pump
MKLRQKQRGLNVAREGEPPKRPLIRLTTVLYLLGLFGLLGYVGWFLVFNVLTVEGRGRVELSRLYVGAGDKGVVSEIMVSEQSDVTKGQPVARLSLEVPEQAEEPETDAPMSLQRDILDAKNDVAQLRSRLDLLEKKLADKRERLEARQKRLRLERSLELRLKKDNESSDLAEEVQELEYDVQEVRAELKNEKEYLADLRRTAGVSKKPRRKPPASRVLVAPANGAVTGIFKGLRDYLTKPEVLMAVAPRQTRARVRGLFNADALEHLSQGREVSLIFPDGTERRGVIHHIYAASSRMRDIQPEQEQNTGPRSKVEVEILPENSRDYAFWEQYNDMPVTIRVRSEWIDFAF